jgi:hypothetical protein
VTPAVGDAFETLAAFLSLLAPFHATPELVCASVTIRSGMVIDRVVIDRVVIDRVVIDRVVIDRVVIERMVIERMIAVSANHSNYLRRAHPETGINVARPRLRRLESLGGHDRADAAIGRNVEKLRGDDNRYGGDTGTYPDDTLREETLICAHFIVP